MSSIIPILTNRLNKTKKLLESPIIKDNAFEFLKSKPFKNIKKTIRNNSLKLNFEDLEYHLTFISESGEKIYPPITTIYLKLNYHNTHDIKYKLIIKKDGGHLETIFEGFEYYNLLLNWQYLTNVFESNSVCMYTFCLHPEKNEYSGGFIFNEKTSISFEIEGLEINELNPLEVNIIIQYWLPNFEKIITKNCLLPLYSYTNFMQVLGQSESMNLLSKKSLKFSFGKLDRYLIVNICEYLI